MDKGIGHLPLFLSSLANEIPPGGNHGKSSHCKNVILGPSSLALQHSRVMVSLLFFFF